MSPSRPWHLLQTGTRRSGGITDGEVWLSAATREHDQYPFGGILVRVAGVAHSHVVVADRLGEEKFPAWELPAPPVLRKSAELADALAPLLRCANQVRALLFRHGEHFYNFQGLRAFKEKFDPVWEPRYLAAQGGFATPFALAHVAALVSGGVAGIVTK